MVRFPFFPPLPFVFWNGLHSLKRVGKAEGKHLTPSILGCDGAGFFPVCRTSMLALLNLLPDSPRFLPNFIFHSLLHGSSLRITAVSHPSHAFSSRLICQLGEAPSFFLSGHPSRGRAPSLTLGHVSQKGHILGREVCVAGVCWHQAQLCCCLPKLRLCSKSW